MGVGTIRAGVATDCILCNIDIAGGREACGKDNKHHCEYQVAGPVHAFLQLIVSLARHYGDQPVRHMVASRGFAHDLLDNLSVFITRGMRR